jgi:hypothetical protein
MVAVGAYRNSMTVRQTGVRPVCHTGSCDQDESLSALTAEGYGWSGEVAWRR